MHPGLHPNCRSGQADFSSETWLSALRQRWVQAGEEVFCAGTKASGSKRNEGSGSGCLWTPEPEPVLLRELTPSSREDWGMSLQESPWELAHLGLVLDSCSQSLWGFIVLSYHPPLIMLPLFL